MGNNNWFWKIKRSFWLFHLLLKLLFCFSTCVSFLHFFFPHFYFPSRVSYSKDPFFLCVLFFILFNLFFISSVPSLFVLSLYIILIQLAQTPFNLHRPSALSSSLLVCLLTCPRITNPLQFYLKIYHHNLDLILPKPYSFFPT